MNKLWFLGGITAAIAIAVIGVGLVSAQTKPATETLIEKPACGCGQKAKCNGGCAGAQGKGNCGCGQKGEGFVDANKNGICDKME